MKGELSMKKYKIIYHLKPDAEDIEVIIAAKSYEDACIFAKQYRRNCFSVQELTENGWQNIR